jgi:hypothetical protein
MKLVKQRLNQYQMKQGLLQESHPFDLDNSPFIRDCKAIKTPENAESTSSPRNLLGFEI